MDFQLENVLVSLHSLKTMGLGPFRSSAPLFLRNGELLFSLFFRYYTQAFFVTRLRIIKINEVQWVDFKLENVLGSIIFKEWRVTRTFSYAY